MANYFSTPTATGTSFNVIDEKKEKVKAKINTPQDEEEHKKKLMKQLLELGIAPKSLDSKKLQAQLADAEMKRSTKKEIEGKKDKEIIGDRVKKTVIEDLKQQLADTQKENEEMKNLAINSKEKFINRDVLKYRRLEKMTKRIAKFKEGDYPRNAMIYFMAMSKYRAGKPVAAMRRGIMNGDLGSFISRRIGGINMENTKLMLGTSLNKYQPKDSDSTKMQLLKKTIFNEIKSANTRYWKDLNDKNQIQ